jgi:hypothetical protein
MKAPFAAAAGMPSLAMRAKVAQWKKHRRNVLR